MTRKSDLAFWAFMVLAGLAGATTVFNVTRTYSATPGNSEIYRQLDLFGDVLERVRSDYVEKPDDSMLIDSAINGMLTALDPHSAYLNPKSFRDMQVQTKGEFGGLGIEVTMEQGTGVVKVVSPIDDTPAAKAGLMANDLITHLDGEQIVGLSLEQAVEKMRGPVNTSITLTILRRGKDEPIDVKIVRDVIRINAVKARLEGDIIYVKISTFNEQTHSNLVKQVEALKKSLGRPARGYVIDLPSYQMAFKTTKVRLQSPFPVGEAAYFVLRNNDPAVDGFLVSRSAETALGLPIQLAGSFGNGTSDFLATYGGTKLASLDLLGALGTHDFTGMSVFGFRMEDGSRVPMEIDFEWMKIEVVATS